MNIIGLFDFWHLYVWNEILVKNEKFKEKNEERKIDTKSLIGKMTEPGMSDSDTLFCFI